MAYVMNVTPKKQKKRKKERKKEGNWTEANKGERKWKTLVRLKVRWKMFFIGQKTKELNEWSWVKQQ